MKNRRRKAALARLEVQLVSNTKNIKIEGIDTTITLSDKDIKRIKKEIAILKEHIKKEAR